MNDEERKIEGVKNLDMGDTLPSSENVDENTVDGLEETSLELNSSPVATEEQIEDATKDNPNVDAELESDIPSEGGVDESIMSNESVEPQPEMTPEQEAVEKMLSQSQVNEIVGRTRTETRDSTLKGIHDRYGVSNESELDSIVGNGQRYDMLHDDYEKVLSQLKEANIKLAMYDSGINPERYEDARFILQGKKLDITPENIKAELATHPEWSSVKDSNDPMQDGMIGDDIDNVFVKKPLSPVSTISRFGNDKSLSQGNAISEEEEAMNLFGIQ